MNEHGAYRTYRVEHVAKRAGSLVVAVCSCGWRSVPLVNGGLAGAAWDQHVADAAVTDPTAVVR